MYEYNFGKIEKHLRRHLYIRYRYTPFTSNFLCQAYSWKLKFIRKGNYN